MLNFDFLQKGLRPVSPPDFVYDLTEKQCGGAHSRNDF